MEEIIFGSDWLVENRCHWDFDSGTLLLRSTPESVQVQLVGTGVRQCIRRIYAKETVELQPGSQSDLAVQSVWTTLPSKNTEWIVEPKELHRGVLMARTLLSGDNETVKVRIVNCSPVPCTVSAGELLTTAEPADSRMMEVEMVSTDSSDTQVQCLIDSLPVGLTDEQRKRAESFLRSYSHAFSKSATN